MNFNKGTMYKIGGMLFSVFGMILTAKGDSIANRQILAELVKESGK